MSDEPKYLDIPAFLHNPERVENVENDLGDEQEAFDFSDLTACRCKRKYSIEKHGKGYAIYWGRCQHKHGANLALLTECHREDLIAHFEKSLNAGVSCNEGD